MPNICEVLKLGYKELAPAPLASRGSVLIFKGVGIKRLKNQDKNHKINSI